MEEGAPQTPAPLPAKSALANLKLWITFGGFLALFVLLGIGYTYYQGLVKKEEPPEVGPNVQKILDAGKIVVGIDATFPPMEYEDEEGNFAGFDVDLIQKIAEELGVEAEVKNIAWDDIFNAVLEGEIDMIVSSVTITEERKELYDFSSYYLNAGQVIITRKEDISIKSAADLVGKKIAVQRGTTNEEQAVLYTADELVLRYDDFIQATQALKEGTADAIFSDLTGAKAIVEENPDLKIASEPFTSDFYGIVFKPGQSDLVEKINEILSSLTQGGYLLTLKQKWLE